MWKCVILAPPRERSREPFKKDVPLNRTEDSHTLVSQCGVGWIPLPRVHLDSLRNTLYALTPSNRKLVLWPPCLTQRSGLSCSSICIHKAQSHSHQVARATVRWGRYSIKICGQTYKMGAEGAGGGVVQEKKNVRLQPTKKKKKKDRQSLTADREPEGGWTGGKGFLDGWVDEWQCGGSTGGSRQEMDVLTSVNFSVRTAISSDRPLQVNDSHCPSLTGGMTHSCWTDRWHMYSAQREQIYSTCHLYGMLFFAAETMDVLQKRKKNKK